MRRTGAPAPPSHRGGPLSALAARVAFFINAMARDGATVLGLNVQEWMSKRIISCRSSDRVDAVLATMTNVRIRHLPVIDDGELKGIVSIGDLVKYRLDEKELEANVLIDIARMRI